MTPAMSRRSSVSRRRSSLRIGRVRKNPPRAAKSNPNFRFVDEKNAEFAKDAAKLKAKKAASKKTRTGKKEKKNKSYSESRSKSRKSTSSRY